MYFTSWKDQLRPAWMSNQMLESFWEKLSRGCQDQHQKHNMLVIWHALLPSVLQQAKYLTGLPKSKAQLRIDHKLLGIHLPVKPSWWISLREAGRLRSGLCTEGAEPWRCCKPRHTSTTSCSTLLCMWTCQDTENIYIKCTAFSTLIKQTPYHKTITRHQNRVI